MTVEEQRTMQAVQKIAQKINDFSLRDYFVGQALSGMGEYCNCKDFCNFYKAMNKGE